MIEKSIGDLIAFGTTVRYLQDGISTTIRGDGFVLANISRFFRNLDQLALTVTRRASWKLEILKDELDGATEAKMSPSQLNRLKTIMREIRPTLLADSGGMIAYIISERRLPIEKLIDAPGSLFAKDVYDKLPELARSDFAEAAKCLAFETATAAAFHMLRATELTLRFYYCEKVKRKRSHLMWGPMVQSMRSMPRRFPDVLLNHLDHIRASFRNPTAHPEKVYDIDESQDLFSICIDVANRMIHDIS